MKTRSSAKSEVRSNNPPVDAGIAAQMANLAQAAGRGNEIEFVDTAASIDWTRFSADFFVNGIQLAFQAGAHGYARRLALTGLESHPKHPGLQKYAEVLAPPAAVEGPGPRVAGLRKNRDWLRSAGENYSGRWVALRNGELLGSAAALQELKAALGNETDLFLIKVP